MSIRRKPGEKVRRQPGSGFCGSSEPLLVRVPAEPQYQDEVSSCMMGCDDPECREWANLEVVGGPFAGDFMYHISECEMFDPSPETNG